jgi:hypothetical protein
VVLLLVLIGRRGLMRTGRQCDMGRPCAYSARASPADALRLWIEPRKSVGYFHWYFYLFI